MSNARVCSACNRPAGPRPKCRYCGAPTKEVLTLVVGPESGNVAGAIGQKVNELRRTTVDPAQRAALFQAAKDRLVALLDQGPEKAEDALRAFDEALAIDTDPYLLLAKAQHLKMLERLAPAVACLDEALAIDRRLVDAWFEKADLLEVLGHLPQSLAAYDTLLALNPRHVQGHCDRDHVLSRLGRVPEALKSCEAALAVDARAVHAWFNKANAELALNQPAAARESFRRFLALGPPGGFGPQVAHAQQALARLGG